MAPGGPDGRGAWRPRRRTDHGGLAGPQVPRPPPAVRVGHGVAGERATVEPAALRPAAWWLKSCPGG